MGERHLGRERQHVHVVGAEYELVGIAFGALAVDVALRAGPAALDRDDDRLAHQVVLLHGRLHGPREQVGAAAGSGRHHELDRLRGLPVGQRGRCRQQGNGEDKVCESFHLISSLERYAPCFADALKGIPTRSPWRARAQTRFPDAFAALVLACPIFGCFVNHKKVMRLMREDGLSVRPRSRQTDLPEPGERRRAGGRRSSRHSKLGPCFPTFWQCARAQPCLAASYFHPWPCSLALVAELVEGDGPSTDGLKTSSPLVSRNMKSRRWPNTSV